MLADEYILVFLFAISYCPSLTFSIWLHNKILSLVFQSAFVRADEFQISAQRKAVNVSRQPEPVQMLRILLISIFTILVSCEPNKQSDFISQNSKFDSTLIGLKIDSAIARLGIKPSQVTFMDEPPGVYSEALVSVSDSIGVIFIFDRTPLIEIIDSTERASVLYSKKIVSVYFENLQTGERKTLDGQLLKAGG